MENTTLQALLEWTKKEYCDDEYISPKVLRNKIIELIPAEKEQIRDAYIIAQTLASDKYKSAEDYYNQNFNNQ